MKKTRVVITGLGVIASNGIGKEAFWHSIKNGLSGISHITRFDASDYPTRIAGEVKDFRITNFGVSEKDSHRMDLAVQYALAGFCATRGMSRNNNNPKQACRPFDIKRDGFVLAEGAGVLILESLEHAQKRQAKIYGEIIGYSRTADAYHLTAPDPSCAQTSRTMKLALKEAELTPEQIDYINAHGSSTTYNDKYETKAIKMVFGQHAYKLVVNSTKATIGHAQGGTGAIEAVSTILAMEKQVVFPTINYEFPDPECDLDYVPNVARERKINYAMSNSFGFGGNNACLVLKNSRLEEGKDN